MSMSHFIPSYHFVPSEKKMSSEWFDEINKSLWHNGGNHNLLEGKDLREIKGYATGSYSMKPYKMMFKSERTKLAASNNENINYLNTQDIPVDGYVQTPLIVPKLNSAISIVDKRIMEATAVAQDHLATEKRQEDITFLKNKPKLEADLQPIADQMQVGKVDLGTTKHSATPFSSNPYGLDLSEPDEEKVFVDLLFNLAVEAGLEAAVQRFADIKNIAQIRTLETKDQFWYGVSTHVAFESAMTLLPDCEYVFPGDVTVSHSNLPDFSDNEKRYYRKRVSALELMNYFGNEICNEDSLDTILNEPGNGYCACNKRDVISQNDFGSCKVELEYCMFKSVDFVGIAPLNKKSKFTYVVTDEKEAEKCTHKVWAQNTYCAWWLKNTKYYFGIHKLGFAHRTAGHESFQSFPLNINKTQEKSAVELSIGENKKAQIADIKMQFIIIKSLPPGRYIDVRFIRNYLAGTTEGLTEDSMMRVLNLALEQNIILGDTEGFDGKNDGQFKSVIDLPGGVKAELLGYMQVIADANAKISLYTGINENLIGQKTEELVRNNNAVINAGINALDYVSKAIEYQYQKLFTNWANIIKSAIKKGGKAKEAIINLIGNEQVNLIDALDDMPLHTIGIQVKINENEKIKEDFNRELYRLKINEVINVVDEYMLEGVTNPKKRMGLLAVKVKQWEKKQAIIRQEQMANQQALVQQQGQNQLAATKEKTASDVEKIYAQGDVSSKILQLASELNLTDKEKDFLMKRALQTDRGVQQKDKSIQTLKTKAELDNQKAFV